MLSFAFIFIIGFLVLGFIVAASIASKRNGAMAAVLSVVGMLVFLFLGFFVVSGTKHVSHQATRVSHGNHFDAPVVDAPRNQHNTNRLAEALPLDATHTPMDANANAHSDPNAHHGSHGSTAAASDHSAVYSFNELQRTIRTPTESFARGFPQGVDISVSFFAILLVGLVIGLFVFGVMRSKTMAGFALVLVLFAIPMMFYWRAASYSTPPVFAAYNSSDAVSGYGLDYRDGIQKQLDHAAVEGDIWTSAVNDKLVSDSFASLNQLGRGIGTRVTSMLRASGKQPDRINVILGKTPGRLAPPARDSQVEFSDMAQGCAERLRIEFPEIEVNSILSGSITSTSETAKINLDVVSRTRRTARWDHGQMQDEFPVQVMLDFGGSQSKFRMNFIQRPWVDDLSHFLAERPNAMLLRSRSTKLQTSANDAMRDSFANAANQVAPLFDNYIAQYAPQLAGVDDKTRKMFLYHSIANNDGSFVIDDFPQMVEINGKRMWRDALLVNVDERRLQHVTDNLNHRFATQQSDKMSKGAGMIGLIVLTIVTGFSLNNLTKGYFKSRIGIGASIAVLLLLFMLVA